MRDLQKRLDRALNPRTVAVVGDKKAMGYMWLNCMSTFQGKVYSVQVDPNEIPGIEEMGIPNFKSLTEIPMRSITSCAVPRSVRPHRRRLCREEGGRRWSFTSGFAETETEEGIAAQEQITKIAREGDLLLIGPNCMGIYNRRLGVRHSTDQAAGDPGTVGFISQSGTHCINFSLMGAEHGIKCSKTVSFGNAVVLDAPDYIDYLANDAETQVMAMYIEGVKDGQRFLASLRAAARRKPVWWKGVTPAGGRPTVAHSVAGDGACYLGRGDAAGGRGADGGLTTIDAEAADVRRTDD
jgi:acyl-CoA synthetase (NDP forming)